jgi:predicted HicB family RNase H-like nuclease
MSSKKTATLNLRIDPILKEAARIAAMRDQRSVANMIEVLIRKHCEEVGIPIPDQQSLFAEGGEDG